MPTIHILPHSGIRNTRTDNPMRRSLTTMIICAAVGLGTAGVLGSTSASAVPSERNSTIQAATPNCYTIYILGKGYQRCSYI
ncbi:hypothetical protein OG689_40925 [Kitasatospora sp. NBC_00240]|uniref:hypothetical protein n=1 Tax=Kitasatospora sp. NBC_00240 TaxID=2903567 RepID=UPI00224F5DC4|nr:hypothetical protein [Kitasatospora sp. NBC_00240]MCX5215531.1 hypothetical protein [Kitasatospora sp. NBC_00240]